MYSITFLGAVSFILALLLTPVVRDTFRRLGLVDHPDGSRKRHARAVPRVGGIPITVAYIFSFGFLFLAGLSGGTLVRGALPLALRILPALLLIFGTGLLDDLIGLKPWCKLAGQIAAACVAYWAGVHVTGVGNLVFADWWSLPVTVFWLVLCTNAVNLIDGVDGLATGVGLFAAGTMLLAALLQNNFTLALATMPLVGCLLGFLRYNFNPATIFLGDSGSLFLGFVLGTYGVLWSEKSATMLGMTAPLMALSIPLVDTALAIVRRFLRRQSIFAADRGHIHHRLLDRGLTPRKVALTIYGLCSIVAIFSLCVASHHFARLALLLFCVGAWIGIQHLGYIELGVLCRMFTEGGFRNLLSSRISLRQYQQQLSEAVTPQECWTVIQSAARHFGFERAYMTLGDSSFEYYRGGNGSARAFEATWEIRIPLPGRNSVSLVATFGEMGQTGIIEPFANMIYCTICAKSAALVNEDVAISAFPVAS